MDILNLIYSSAFPSQYIIRKLIKREKVFCIQIDS